MTSQPEMIAKLDAEDAAFNTRRAAALAAELREKADSESGIDHNWLCFWAGQVSYVLEQVAAQAGVEAIAEASK